MQADIAVRAVWLAALDRGRHVRTRVSKGALG